MNHRYLTTAEVSEYLRRSPETLRYWRWRSEGPPSFKIGRTVVYEESDLLAWIKRQKETTSAGTYPAA